MIVLRSLKSDAIRRDALESPEMEKVARAITRTANRMTSAKVGFTQELEEDHWLLGPTGAAAVPVEVGTFFMPAKRYFKAALDSHEI